MAGTTNYFLDFPKVNYNFGTNELPIQFQDLSIYIDLFDQVAEYDTFYENYQVQNNERADHVSYQLYETTDYSWTFFLLNEKLRQTGWPMDNFRLFSQAKEYYPHATAMTTGAVYNRITNSFTSTSISRTFIEGATVWFNETRVSGTVVTVNHDLGQIVVKLDEDRGFTPEDIVENRGNLLFAVTEDQRDQLYVIAQRDIDEPFFFYEAEAAFIIDTLDYIEISGPDTLITPSGDARVNKPAGPEWDSIHHFADVDGNVILPGYYNPAPSLYAESYALRWSDVNTVQSTTYLERLQQLNEDQRAIQVIRPDAIQKVVNEFRSLLKN